ncbi:hypothetical protein C7999DRAFT_31188 [Corynascus novoguineensis]|uniref:Peroxisomal membrane protein PEX17 n=1 Tax=Corynascus novoguineensis TaxID=1126955 RepID=A0AAN7CWY3_9PEZI|nr:hypothetical protein C7999DRAFT_31188 [Corynascus novoguineensis]
MSIDRLLTTVLQLYQDVHDDARTEQIYSSTAALLANLSNPLNLSLLTSQLLIAPAIWGRRDGMRTCYRIISIFNTAAIHVRRNELEKDQKKGQPRAGGGLGSDAWAAAVLKGADDQSGRWQHLLVFSGVLMGMESGERRSLSRSMRDTVERAVVTATNLAIRNRGPEPPAPSGPVALALNYAFSLLSESSRAGLDCDALVPVVLRAMLGGDGLQDGVFLASIDQDVRQAEQRFMWLENSPSYLHLKQLEQRPLVAGLGPLSTLLSYAVQHARNSAVVLQLQDDLVAFTSGLLQYWQANKLSELDFSEESIFLTPETLQTTWPALWQFLKRIMYAVVSVLHSIIARSLLDRHLKHHTVAPTVATKTLHTLRNLYFISSRNGSDAFQVYTFTYLTSLDILSRYGPASASFLRSILPQPATAIPPHPLHRTLDLFYLNTAEHLPLNLPPQDCEALIITPATTYLTTPPPPTSSSSSSAPSALVPLFEAAHSAVLAALSCPHNAALTTRVVPFYADALFASFPARISPRQFRLAFRTILQILGPPFAASWEQAELGECLLEIVRYRVPTAGREILPSSPASSSSSDPHATADGSKGEAEVSEQSTLVLTLIDALPFLRVEILEEWMTLAAAAVHEIVGERLREGVKRRFWEVLVSGEMDVERAAVAVAWWGTKGGREAVLFGKGIAQSQQGGGEEAFMMSGAIVQEGRESRL